MKGSIPTIAHRPLHPRPASRKFWEATVKGKDLTVRFGRVGTEGQRVPKSFASPAAAAAGRDKLVAQKRRKGYG